MIPEMPPKRCKPCGQLQFVLGNTTTETQRGTGSKTVFGTFFSSCECASQRKFPLGR